jgi:hypothetical protein
MEKECAEMHTWEPENELAPNLTLNYFWGLVVKL